MWKAQLSVQVKLVSAGEKLLLDLFRQPCTTPYLSSRFASEQIVHELNN